MHGGGLPSAMPFSHKEDAMKKYLVCVVLVIVGLVVMSQADSLATWFGGIFIALGMPSMLMADPHIGPEEEQRRRSRRNGWHPFKSMNRERRAA